MNPIEFLLLVFTLSEARPVNLCNGPSNRSAILTVLRSSSFPVDVVCCADNFTRIDWFYQSKGSSSNSSVPNQSWQMEWKENLKILHLKRPTPKENDGIYTCVVQDNSASLTIWRAYIIFRGSPIVVPTPPSQPLVDFVLWTTAVLDCSFPAQSNAAIKWEFSSDNSRWQSLGALNASRESTNRISVGSRLSIEMRFIDSDTVRTELVLTTVAVRDAGYYRCSDSSKKYVIQVSVSFEQVYTAIILLPSLLLLCAGCFLFRYDLIILWKCYVLSIFSKKISADNFNHFSIFYASDDKESLNTALRIDQDLSSRGFSCYIYDRNQVVGRSKPEEYCRALDTCHTAVFLFTETALQDQDFCLCLRFALSRYYPVRRYVVCAIGSKWSLSKAVQSSVEPTFRRELSAEIRQCCYTSVRSWTKNWDQSGWSLRKRNFTRWLISALPTEAARANSDRDNVLV